MTQAAASDPLTKGAGASRLLSDDRLALRATKGDRRAFEAIYKRYHRDLYRFCLAMVGNPQDAQDALQNTMVKVLRALPGEKRRIQLKPWLYRIARNEAMETLRKRRDSAEIEPDQTASMEGVAETAEMRERLRRLIADLEELPERQRAALVMRELAGLGFAQIGAAFETSAAVARQTIYEARLSLRQMEEGREMGCDRVMRELSDADGRVTRRREVRAHLRGCASCRAFRDSMAPRRGELAAISPLPLALSAGMLHGILSGNASAATTAGGAAGAAGSAGAGTGAGGGLAGTIGAGAGKAVATSAILKSAATVAVVAAVGATAADRGGLIDVPILGGGAKSSQTSSPPPTPAGSATGAAAKSGEGAEAGGQAGSRAGGGTQRAGLLPATSPAAAQAGRSGSAAYGAGAQRTGSGRGASARAHSGDRGRSHAERHGRPKGPAAASNHGQQAAAPHKAAAHSKGSPSSHTNSPKRSPRHTGGGRTSPPKPAPPNSEGAAATPASPPAPSEPPAAGTSGSADRPASGVE